MFGEGILGYDGTGEMNLPGGCSCKTKNSWSSMFWGTTLAANSDGTSPLTGEKDNFTCIEMEVYKVISD